MCVCVCVCVCAGEWEVGREVKEKLASLKKSSQKKEVRLSLHTHLLTIDPHSTTVPAGGLQCSSVWVPTDE